MSVNKRHAARGIVLAWFGRVVAIGVSLVVTPVLIHRLGESGYGIWSLLVALAGYYGLADLGIGKANIKYMAECDIPNENERVKRLVSTSVHTHIQFCRPLLIAVVVVGIAFALTFQSPQFSFAFLFLVTLLTGARVAVELVGSTYRTSLIAGGRFDVENVVGLVSHLVTATLMVTAVMMGAGLITLCVIMLGMTMMTVLAAFAAGRQILNLPAPSRRYFDPELRSRLVKFGLFSVVNQVARRLSLYGGGFIVGLVMGPAAVAYYAVAESMTQRIAAFGKSINQVTMPIASRLTVEKQSSQLRYVTELSFRVLLALSLCVAVVLGVFGRTFLVYWISPEFARHAYPCFVLLACSLVFRLPGVGLQAVLEGQGSVKALARLTLIEGLLTITSGFALVPWLGATGMGIGVLLAQGVISGLCIPVMAFRVVGSTARRYLGRLLAPALVATVPTTLLAMVFINMHPTTLLSVCLMMGTTTFVGLASVFICCIDRPTQYQVVAGLLPGRLGLN